MDPASIMLAVFIVLLVSTGITLSAAAIRRAVVTQSARRALPGSDQPVAEQVWHVREVSESPHLRVIAARDVTSTNLALIRVEQTLATLPRGHRDLADLQGERLATIRAMRNAVVANVEHSAETPLREKVGGVAAGLVRGMAGAPQLPGYPNLRRALASGVIRQSRSEPAVANPAMRRVQAGIDRFLGRRDIGPAQDLLSRVGIGMSTEASELLDKMEGLGALVTAEHLEQLADESEQVVYAVAGALQQIERELARHSRWEGLRRAIWPSVGDRVAQDTVAYGRSVLLREHQAHRRLRTTLSSLVDADPRLRGTVWALTLRDLPPGAIAGPDLTSVTPALEAYLRSRPRR